MATKLYFARNKDFAWLGSRPSGEQASATASWSGSSALNRLSPDTDTTTYYKQYTTGDSWSWGPSPSVPRGYASNSGEFSTALVTAGRDYASTRSSVTEEFNGLTFSTGGSLTTARYNHAGGGNSSAAFIAGGYTTAVTNTTEEYDGATWSSGGNLSASKRDMGSAGTLTAGLVWGGYTTSRQSVTEEYDGSSWTSGGALPIATRYPGGCGTQSAGLSVGGEDSGGYKDESYEYDGASWAAGGLLSAATYECGVAGTQSDAVAVGGNNTRATATYNGTSFSAKSDSPLYMYFSVGAGGGSSGSNLFTSVTTYESLSLVYGTWRSRKILGGRRYVWVSSGYLNDARQKHASAGTESAGMSFGGEDPAALNTTDEYDGSTWTVGGTLGASPVYCTGAGTQTAGLCVAGYGLSASYEYDGSSWSSGGSLSANRTEHSGGGTQTAAFATCGYVAVATLAVSTEEYDGGSWSAGGNMLSYSVDGTGCGTLTSGFMLGGAWAYGVLYEYDGASWAYKSTPSNPKGDRPAFYGGSSSAVLAGGSSPSLLTVTSSVEEWDGTAFSCGSDPLALATYNASGFGSSPAGVVTGGNNSGILDYTQRYQAEDYTPQTYTGYTAASTSPQSGLCGMFVSQPLKSGTTVGGGSMILAVSERESNLFANYWINSLNVYVWRPSTNTKVGTVRDASTSSLGGTEPTTANAWETTYITGITSSSVVAAEGDVIVVEVWSYHDQSKANTYTVDFGFNGETAISTENASNSDPQSFIQFAETIEFNIEESHTRAPGAGSLTITGYAPTDVRNYVFTPGSYSLGFTGYQPADLVGGTALPGNASLAVTGYAPSMLFSFVESPGTASLSVTTYAPVVSIGKSIAVDSRNVAITGYAPSLRYDLVVSPGATDPYYSNVQCFMKFEGADTSTTFTDETGKTWSYYGNAQIDTGRKQWGWASGLFDGSGDYLQVSTDTGDYFDFSNGDFTVEGWFYVTSVPSAGQYPAMFGKRYNSTTNFGWYLILNGDDSGKLKFCCSSSGAGESYTVSSLAAPSTSAWHSFAVVRSGADLMLYLDGVKQNTTNIGSATIYNSSIPLMIGRLSSNISSNYWNGSIDHIRITKGTGRYTASSYVPAEYAYVDPNSANPNPVSVTGYAPSLRVDVYKLPGSATLALTGYAPSVGSVSVSPESRTVTISTYAPTASVNVAEQPGSYSLALTGYQPSRLIDYRPSPGTRAVSITTYAPVASIGRVTQPGSAQLVITRYQPAAGVSYTFAMQTRAMVLSAYAPVRSLDTKFLPPQATLAITGYAPDASSSKLATPDTAALVVTRYAPSVKLDIDRAPGAASLTVARYAPIASIAVNEFPGAASLTLSGHAPSLQYALVENPGAVALTLSRYAPALLFGFVEVVPAAVITITAYAPSLSLEQYLRPIEDITPGGWLPSSGAELWPMLDEGVPNDSDYIYGDSSAGTCEVAVESASDPQVSTGHKVRYRIRRDAGGPNLIVSLYCETTLIASWTHADVPTVYTTYEQTLSGAQADNIFDYSALRLRFEETA